MAWQHTCWLVLRKPSTMGSIEQQIFQRGSTTYYFSSQFFPGKIRGDVFKLYSFVRVVDDCVDGMPARTEEFHRLRTAWDRVKNDTNFDTKPTANDNLELRVIKNIVHVMHKYHYDQAWIESFWDSMQADLDKKSYRTIEDTMWYMYGSAEVIGLMMARIMGLGDKALEAAKLQGRAMQFINFLRDIAEDNALGRCYFPVEDLKKYGLSDLRETTVLNNQQQFKDFMEFELERYNHWQAQADQGFKYIPRRLRVPLQTAVDMYNWTGRVIAADPMIVFNHKVKPRKRRILARGIYNGVIIIPSF